MIMMQRLLPALVLPALSLLAACSDSGLDEPIGAVVTIAEGKPAPDFTLKDQNGKVVRLSDYRGKVVYLDFWASWCEPCLRVLPDLKQTWAEYRDEDFVILGVSLDYTEDEWKSFIAAEKMDWVQTFDDGGSRDGALQVYQVRAIPQTYLLDRDGVLVKANLHGDALRDSIDIYLSK